jgi:histone H3/H4
MGSIRKPRNESDKATLARIMKEMAQPRIAKSARKGA